MFGSAIGTWRPCHVGVFGLPYHGRLDAASAVSTAPLVLSLPNGGAMTVRATVPNPDVSRAPYGNCRVFRDPRAVEVSLDAAEQAQAAAAGAQWRPSAIISEIGALGGVITRSMIYHDGSRNWGIIYNSNPGGTTRAESLPVIRVGSDSVSSYTAAATYHYTLADLAAPSGAYAQTANRIIDSLPDGSRHLIGLYGVRSGTGRPGRGHDMSGELYALIELELSGPGESMTATYRLLYSPAAIQGAFSRSSSSNITYSYTTYSWGWTTYDLDAPSTSYVDWELEQYNDPVPPSSGFRDGTLTAQESCVNRVIGAYYADGAVRTITMDYANTRVMVTSTTMTTTDNPAHGTGRGGPVFGITLTSPGDHTCVISESITETSSLTLTISDAGTVVSSVVGSGSTTRSRSVTRRVAFTAGPDGRAILGESASASTNLSCSQHIAHDGHALHDFEDSRSWSSNRGEELPSTAFRAGSGSNSGGYPALISCLSAISPEAYDNRLDLCPVLYNPSLLALSSRMWPATDTSAVTLRIGAATCRGQPIPGWREGALPVGGIWGSVNPITGEYARDTPRTVLWL